MLELPGLYEWPSGCPFGHGVWPIADCPELDALEDQWSTIDRRHWYTSANANVAKKYSLNKPGKMPESAQTIMNFLQGDKFVEWLRDLSAIPDLTPDPSMQGGGLHEMRAGGFLNMHVDFNRLAPLWQRVNVLMFVNRHWPRENGGQLVLSETISLLECEHRVDVLPERCLTVFDYSSRSFHGVPFAVEGDESRKSIASYYYSATPPKDHRERKHSTLYGTQAQ